MSLVEDFSGLQQRFEKLARGDEELEALGLVASGLMQILGGSEFHEEELFRPTLKALQELAGRLESLNPAQTTPKSTGLEQFLDTFRKDAEKRLRGLSISLMGVFGDSPSEEAMDQSAGHLHAIRGGAAMLQIEDVAELSRVMEAVILCKAKLAAEDRNWPTRTLLRAFAILHDAIQSDPVAVTADDFEEVMERLRGVAGIAGCVKKKEVTPQDEEKPAEERGSLEKASVTLEQPVLVVDDIDTIAASVGFILAELEVPIEVASNGEEAFHLLQTRPFSLVISDVDMPRMDGITLTRKVRSDPNLAELPLILLTSLDRPEERQAGLDAGATDYLIKGSIGGGELLDKVRAHLEKAPVYEIVEPQGVTKILVAEDTETVAASIAFVLSERPYEIVLCGDGREALKKLERGQFDLLITDMQMPYMGGIELVGQLRQKARFTDLPVIMLTSVQDEELVTQARQAGVDRYLIKGEIAGGKLLKTVDELLASLS